ncbi:cytochrome P450 6k1 [Cephus cinctus]|uniref:Cytochrome P450 6k1 n=1 Tax=Cephus cinctus TaxID=211228 RepID=A0AAJ7C1H7_CEPCN|nr:cytochrome P450 6k1 [Cephus cinctus]
MSLISGLVISQLLGIVILLASCVYLYFKYVIFEYWRKKGVIQVEPSFPCGNLSPVVLGKLSAGELIANAYSQHKKSPFFGTYTFHKPRLVVNDPDLIRFVLTKEFAHFHDRGLYCNEEIDPLSGHLFFLSGIKWKNLRGKLTPTFTSGKLKRMFSTIKDCGDHLGLYLVKHARNREEVEIKDIIARFSTDNIMSTAFGISCNSIENPESEFRKWGRKIFESRPIFNAIVVFAPNILDFFSIPFTDKGVNNFFTRIFKETVEYRETNNIVRNDFMDLIMQLMHKGYVDEDKNNKDDNDAKPVPITESKDGRINILEAAAQAFVFFVAGFETSSSTVAYCLYELALHRDIQEKVRQDIDAGLQKCGGLTYESLAEMTYLHKVVSETLRKYPTVPILNRICTKDIELPGTNVVIPKGLDVMIPVLGIQRDPSIYPDPDKFDPERFNEENIAARHAYTYLPFGEGPRICIGMRFGYAQVKVALISVLTRYRCKPGPKTPEKLIMDPGNFILQAKGGIHLVIEPR